MGTTKKSAGTGKPGSTLASRSRRIRKSMEIDRDKLAKARRILGSESDTRAIDQALDLVIANREIEAAIETAFGSLPGFKVA